MVDQSSTRLEQWGRVLGVLVILGAVGLGGWVWHLNMIHPRTNDAMIRANTIDVAIQHVNGKIIELPVKDNQFVHAGDLLYAIDARPFEAAVAAANAALQLAQKEVKGQMAEIKMAEAKVLESEQAIQSAAAEVKRVQAEETFAASYLARLKPLEHQQFISSNALKQAEANQKAQLASVHDAQAKVRAAEAALNSSHQSKSASEQRLAQFGNEFARIQQAEAKLHQAQLDLEYCRVYAPFDGYVTNLNTSVGQFVSTGETLFALVDDTTWYVIANYKETYLRYIEPGMPVDVFLAAYPGIHFKGEVQGVGWANYPDNVVVKDALPTVARTLNWVVLAGRFPVRIRLIDRDPDHPFRMGMTAFTSVGVNH